MKAVEGQNDYVKYQAPRCFLSQIAVEGILCQSGIIEEWEEEILD